MSTLSNSDLFVVSRGGVNYSVTAQTVAAFANSGAGSVSSVTGTGGITVSPTTGAVVVNGSGKLNLTGGTMTGALITSAGSSSAPSLGIGSNTKGFYAASNGTAYAPSSSLGGTFTIDNNGILVLAKQSALGTKNYGGGALQVFGDSTSGQGGAAGVFGQLSPGTAGASSLTLMTGGGSLTSPTIRTTGELGRLQWADITSTTNLAPVPRAYLLGYKEGNQNQTWLQIAVNNATNSSPTTTWQFQSTAFRPIVDNNQPVGTSQYRPSVIFAATGVINTSDSSLKKNITPVDGAYGLDFIKALNPVTYQWVTEYNDVSPNPENPDDPNDVIVTPVPGEITHFGFLADEVSSAMEDIGIVDCHCDGLVGQNKDLPAPYTEDADPANLEQYWLNMAQITPCLVKSVQQLSEALETLQAEFDAYVAANSGV